MSYKLKGTIKLIKETQQVIDKFQKREFVLTDNESMYPQDILFQAVQDKCSMLDSIKEGQTVEVSFNLRGREWINKEGEAKYFNSLDAWRIEGVSSDGTNPNPKPGPLPDDMNTSEGEDNSLSF